MVGATQARRKRKQKLTTRQGLRYGLELCHSMANNSALRDQRGQFNNQLLVHIRHWHLDRRLPDRVVHHSNLWSARVWRRYAVICAYLGSATYIHVVEFILSMVKVIACTGFIIFGTVVNCGGVSSDPRGYIGAHYWHDPGAFRNGFQGFCSVFVTASFAFGGTELTGLAAAESENPRKQIPKAPSRFSGESPSSTSSICSYSD